MWLSVFYILGTLLAFSMCNICPETSEDAAPWVKLKPLGYCGDEDDSCPFQVTLPPLSIQLPKPFRELEKMAKELQNLKEVVNQLRRDCQECKDRYSAERGDQTDYGEEEESRPQSPKHNISFKETQSHSGEQVVQTFTSTLLQGDTSESDRTGIKVHDHSILEGQEWTTDPRTDLNKGTIDKRIEMNREVKILKPSLDQEPDDISNATQVPTTAKDRMPKHSGLIEQSLPKKKDSAQLAIHGKQQPDIVRNVQVKNISDILKERKRVPGPNGLSSNSTDANTKTMDLGTLAGNKRDVKFPGAGVTLRPKRPYINGRGINVNNRDRLNNPALVRKQQSGHLTVKTEPEEAGFSPARSGVMRIKETSQTQKPGATSGLTLLTDQNKQDIRVSGPKTDDGYGLKIASQVTIVRENILRRVNKTEITRIPTNPRKEKQGIVSHTATNTTISSGINHAEQPIMVKEDRKRKGSESLEVISRETETSSTLDTEDLTLSGRQVEKEKYLNPISDTNNGQIDSIILDTADSTLNARTANPLSTDLNDKMQPETESEIGLNLRSSGTEKTDIPSNTKATMSEKDLVRPTIVPTEQIKLAESTVSMNKMVQSPRHGIRRISLTPLADKPSDKQSQNNKKNVSNTREGTQDNIRYVRPNPTRNPKTHPSSVIIPGGPKLRQPNMMDKVSGNRSVGAPVKQPISVRNSNITRKNSSGIIKPYYTRTKPNFQPAPNTNRGDKTKVSTVTQFFSPTRPTSTIEEEETKIPQVIRSNVLDNHWLQNNSTDSKSQPDSQNPGDTGHLKKVHEGKDKAEDNSETVSISNFESSVKDPNMLHRETSNLPTAVKEEKTYLATADIYSEHTSEPDRISSGKKRPSASILKKELSREPGITQITTSTVSLDTVTEKIYIVTSKHGEMAKNLSQDASVSFKNLRATPNENLNILDNQWLRNNSEESKSQSEPQYSGTVQDLDNVQQGKNQVGDKNETVSTSNVKSREDLNTLQTGASNSHIGGKEINISSLGTIETSRQSEAEKISSGEKRPTTPTLKKELLKKPGITHLRNLPISVTNTGRENRTKNIRKVTNKHVEMAKNLSRDASVRFENIRATPGGGSKVLDNQRLENNSSKSQPESRNAGNVQDLEEVQQGKNKVGDKREIVLTSNIERSAEDPNTFQSGAPNSPTGGKESKISTFRTADTSSQFEGDKISSGKKRPTAPTLKKELSKKPGMTQFSTSTVSFTDTDPEDIHTEMNTRVEMAKNVSRDTPISFENIEATRELELIKLNKDRVEENPGEILSNPNTADTAQSYNRERNTIPSVLETLRNVEEIKGSKLFSLSPEDTEGFKSHDEVTEKEKEGNNIHSTCVNDCNTTSTQHSQPSTTQTRPPPDSTREKGPAQDCSDYITKSRRNGVYRVTPHPKNNTFPVLCDMKSSGGGWTLIQHRFDGSTSFNRTWDEYKKGFGKLLGEFWLGNDKIHLLTKEKNMSLRIEIEDFEGIREYAHYDYFFVANESQQYRLSIGGYSGTAGDAMQFSKKYNHNQKLFTTPDRDNDQYPSGNCGAYYSSGWWFDACMSANLNGKYYQSKYKGVRNGIFWGTWHNITMEYYPTNDRQSFKTVRMMIRPKN